MTKAGYTLLFFGLGSTFLYFAGYQFAILSWIDSWGETVAWSIRGGLIAGGVVLTFAGSRFEDDVGAPAD